MSKDVVLSQFDPDNLTADLVEEHISDLEVINNVLTALTNLGNALAVGRYKEPTQLGIESLTATDNTLTQTTTDGAVRVFDDIKLGGQTWKPSLEGSGVLVAADDNRMVFTDIFSEGFEKEETENAVKLTAYKTLLSGNRLDYAQYASAVYIGTAPASFTLAGITTYFPLNYFETNSMLDYCRLDGSTFLRLEPGLYFLRGIVVTRSGLNWRIRIHSPDPINTIEFIPGTLSVVSGYSHNSTTSQRTSKLCKPTTVVLVKESGARIGLYRDNNSTNTLYGGGFEVFSNPPQINDRWIHNVHCRIEVWKIG